jgi:regulator of sigma E protease
MFAILAAITVVQILEIILMIFVGTIALSVVVIIHELGHFIAAKRAGVEVEAFSVGFGPRIWGVKKGGTDYRISAVLFGGYVKMKGMEAEGGKEPYEVEGGFFAAKPGPRALIAFAAPAMNVLLALAVFTLLWFTGRKVPAELLTNRIGYVEKGSSAMKAGLVPGDSILEINGKPVRAWKDVLFGVAFSPSDPVSLTIKHNDVVIEKKISPKYDRELGVNRLRIEPKSDVLVADVKKDSLAQKIGLRSEDKLATLAGENLYHIVQFQDILQRNVGKKVDLVVTRKDGSPRTRTLSFVVPFPEEGIFVKSVKDASLAKKTGLKGGDILVGAAGQEVHTLNSLQEILKDNRGKEIKLEILREKNPSSPGKPASVSGNAWFGAELEEDFPRLGFLPGSAFGIKKENPIKATYSAIGHVIMTLKGLMTRKVSAKGLSGPVGIVGMIAKSISVSFTTFLYFIAFLSANLAVVNLLPIPIVDGGHIMFCAIEKLRGKPIRQKTMTIIVNIFFVLILAFFLFVTWNDVVRFAKGGPEKEQGRTKLVLTLKVPEQGN